MTRSRGPNRGRFANRVNRSSSLHNLEDQAEGVKWRDNFSPPQDPVLPSMTMVFIRR